MNDKIKNALGYVKAHKKEIIIGGGLIIVGSIIGSEITHKHEFGTCHGKYKFAIGFDKLEVAEIYNSFFKGEQHILGGFAAKSIKDKDDLINTITKACKNIPEGEFYNVIVEAADNNIGK